VVGITLRPRIGKRLHLHPETTMKLLLRFASTAFLIGFFLPTFAQEKEIADRRIAQERDLLGNALALDEFGDLSQKLDEAYNKNSAAKLAALFTEDAVLVAPEGMFNGRQAIEKRYEETFKGSPFTLFSDPRDYQLNAIDNAVWSVGKWWSTLQVETGPVFVSGYWSAIYVREGDAWRIRLLTLSEHPRPASSAADAATLLSTPERENGPQGASGD
jgi:uncharacterized protein (TIGR02246 family)